MMLSVVLRSLLSIGLLSAGVAVFLLLGKSERPPQKPTGESRPMVEVVRAEEHGSGVSFSVDGLVRPYRDLQVAAESGGRVVSKAANCRPGRTVKAGEVLIQIDPRDYQFEVRRLEKELEQAEASTEELDVQIANSQMQIKLAEQDVVLNERELARVEGIKIPGVITDSDIDVTRRDLLNSRTALQTQQDQARLLITQRRRLVSIIDRTNVDREAAQLALDRCVIRAPIDGVVTEEHVEQDGYVQQGEIAFTVRDTSRVDVVCSLRADQLAWLWKSRSDPSLGAFEFPTTPVTVVYEFGDQEFAWQGVLARYDGAGLDDQTRMAPCVVRVDDPRAVKLLSPALSNQPPPTLMVGMFVEVRIRLQPQESLVTLPSRAVRPGNRVWTINEGRLKLLRVRVADAEPDRVLVYSSASGLSAGDEVVVSPLASPRDGDPVRVGESS